MKHCTFCGASMGIPAQQNEQIDISEKLTQLNNTADTTASNMIGERKRINAFDNDGTYMTMFNPEIIIVQNRGRLSFSARWFS